MQIDARGKHDPQPVLIAAETLATMTEGVIEVLVDNVESSLNLREYAVQRGMGVVQVREGRDWKIRITKGRNGVSRNAAQ